MSQYLYLATNSAMPGLVKIGYTTREPSDRMAELQSTGVPRPFELELVLVVEDGKVAEQAAHHLCLHARESSSREFFRLTVDKAVEVVLNGVAYLAIDWRHTSKHSKSKALAQRSLKDRLANLDIRIAEARRQLSDREASCSIRQLMADKSALSSRLIELGKKPSLPEMDGLSLLASAYQPLPFGWVFWLGSIAQWSKGNSEVAVGLAVFIAVGFLSSKVQSERSERYARSVVPWELLSSEISSKQQEIDVRETLNRSILELQAERSEVARKLEDLSDVPQPIAKGRGVSPVVVTPEATTTASALTKKDHTLKETIANTVVAKVESRGIVPLAPSDATTQRKTAVTVYRTSVYRAHPIFEVEKGCAAVLDGDLYIYESKGALQAAIDARLAMPPEKNTEGLIEILKRNTFYPAYPRAS